MKWKNFTSLVSIRRIFMIVLAVTGTSCVTGGQEGTVADKLIINGRFFGDDQRTASINQSGAIAGNIIWEKPNAPEGNPMAPMHLAIYDTLLIEKNQGGVNVRDRKRGEPGWSRELYANFAFNLDGEGLTTLDGAGYVEILGMDQKIIRHFRLPFLKTRTFLHFIHAQGDTFSYVFLLQPKPTSKPGEEGSGPQFSFIRFSLKENNVLQEFVRKELINSVARANDGSFVCVASPAALYIIDGGPSGEKDVREIPMSEIFSCSIDHDNNIVIIARELPENEKEEPDKNLLLISLTREGQENWRYPLGESLTLSQPPVLVPDGSIYLVDKSDLYCISGGEQKWKMTLPIPPGSAFLTGLADNSVLVAGGLTLVEVSPDGEELARMAVKDSVTCRPVMDENERVYLGTQSSVLCIE
jgi:hypothetical protein